MNLFKNETVQKFLNDIKVVDNKAFDIIIEVRKIIFDNYSKADEKVMYGGIVFFFNEEMFSGVFSYKITLPLNFQMGF